MTREEATAEKPAEEGSEIEMLRKENLSLKRRCLKLMRRDIKLRRRAIADARALHEMFVLRGVAKAVDSWITGRKWRDDESRALLAQTQEAIRRSVKAANRGFYQAPKDDEAIDETP